TGGVVVSSNGGMLLGTGTITGNVTVNAGNFLLPGDFVAGGPFTSTLTVAGNVTFAGASEFFIIANSSTNFSHLFISGTHTVTLGSGSSQPTVGVSQNQTPFTNPSLLIISSSSASSTVVGTFATPPSGNISTGFAFPSFTYASPSTNLVILDPPLQDATPLASVATSVSPS